MVAVQLLGFFFFVFVLRLSYKLGRCARVQLVKDEDNTSVLSCLRVQLLVFAVQGTVG